MYTGQRAVRVSSRLAGMQRFWSQRTRHGLTSLYARGRGATVARDVRGPDFIIIGTQRGGTTSLYRYLVAHPDVVAPLTKEIHYFSTFYHRGPGWYRGHFSERATHQRTFEASPYYLAQPAVPQRVAADLPETRFVALLRDPVERAYSHYRHNVALGLERLSFADAIEAERDRLAAAAPARSRAWTEDVGRRYSYVTRGLYAEQLRRWYAHVDPERILVLRSEDLYEQPAATYARVVDFVGLRPLAETETVSFDVHNHWRSSAPSQLTPELRSHLSAVFEPHNEELRQMRLGNTWT
jgi:hypothetical protein